MNQARSGHTDALPGRRRALTALALFLIALAGYLYNVQYRLWGAGGDTTPAELLPISILHEHDLDFDEFVRPGQALPYWFTASRGRIISSYPILPGILNTPVYAVAEILGVPLQPNTALLSIISASLITAASVGFVYLSIAALFPSAPASFLALVYAFGSTAFSVAARGMWQHTGSLLLLSLAIWLLTGDGNARAFGAGLALGFAVANRPINALIVFPLVIWMILARRRSLPPFVLGGLPGAAFLLVYSQVYWGSIGSLGQFPTPLAHYRMNPAVGLAGLLVSPSRGLLVFTPVFAFSLAAIVLVLFRGDRSLLAPLGVGVALTLAVYSLWHMWWGGSAFGYRLLTDLVPILVLFIAWAWTEFVSNSTGHKILFGAALIVAIYTNLLGAFLYPCGFNNTPDDINANPRRLWDWRNGEITRCSETLWGRVEQKLPKLSGD